MATAATDTKPRSRKATATSATGSGPSNITSPSNLVGKVSQVIGAVVDVAFEGDLPADPHRARDRQWRQPPRPRSRTAPRRECRPHNRDGLHRRPHPRAERPLDRLRDPRARRSQDARADHERDRRADRRARARSGATLRPRSMPKLRPSSTSRPKLRSWSPGSRSSTCSRLTRKRRQDRPVRRRRRWQDRADPGADQQHRQGPRRRVGVRRRRRAHARRQRPLPRVPRRRRHRQGRRRQPDARKVPRSRWYSAR